MGAHVAHQFDSVTLLETEVGNYHVRAELSDSGTRILHGFRLAANHEVLLVLHYLPQPLANDRVIIDDQNPPDGTLAPRDPRLSLRCPYPCSARAHIPLLHKWHDQSVTQPRLPIAQQAREITFPR